MSGVLAGQTVEKASLRHGGQYNRHQPKRQADHGRASGLCAETGGLLVVIGDRQKIRQTGGRFIG